METIKEVITAIYDQEYTQFVMVPIRTMQMFNKIMNDKIPVEHDYIIVMNSSRSAAWPDVIFAKEESKHRFDDVKEVMAFFKGAGCPIIATKVNGIETIYHRPIIGDCAMNYFGVSAGLRNNMA